jgi:hypothetical protein
MDNVNKEVEWSQSFLLRVLTAAATAPEALLVFLQVPCHGNLETFIYLPILEQPLLIHIHTQTCVYMSTRKRVYMYG